jgi:hypothetical protein
MSALPLGAEENGATSEPLKKAIALIKEALDLVDQSDAPLEVAARVQAAIDAVEQYRASST